MNGDLHMGHNLGSTGTYALSGGTLNVTGDMVNGSGTSTLNLDGGTLNVAGSIDVDDFRVGSSIGASGSYAISDGQHLSLKKEYIGYRGTGELSQTGGTNSADYLYVGHRSGATGTYAQSGGINSLDLDLHMGFYANGVGNYSLSGDAALSAHNENLGTYGTGVFTQTGGSNDITWNLKLGDLSGGSGTYNLSGDESITLTTTNNYIGNAGNGIFNQSDGDNLVKNNLYIGNQSGGTGAYHLTGGTLTIEGDEAYGREGNAYVGKAGSGMFTQSDGTHTVGGTLFIAAEAGSSGTYNLSGGTLDVADGVVNNDNFNYQGDELNADFTNNGTASLTGAGIRTVNGDVTNTGTFKTTNTVADYTGTFTNAGAYLSFLTGTDADALVHDLYITGYDYGDTASGYSDNFSWGTLLIGDDNSLNLFDGNAQAGGGMYVGELLGIELLNGMVDNIYGNGLNIYYSASLAANAYLGGQTYGLRNGGQLIAFSDTQEPVPEPTSLLLLASGILGLAWTRRKFRR